MDKFVQRSELKEIIKEAHIEVLSAQEDKWTAKQAAEYLDIDTGTLYEWIKAKKIRAYKLGKSYSLFKTEINQDIKKYRAA